MPRLVHQNPSYRKHRASGQAIVTIGGQDVCLGPHGSKVSRDEYDRVIGEWLANGRSPVVDAAGDLAVSELIDAYWQFAKGYYNSESTGEIEGIRLALKTLRQLYGRTLVNFGPLALKSVRSKMIEQGWARTYINAQVGRIRRMFKWGVEQEMVSAVTLHALQAIGGLREGKT